MCDKTKLKMITNDMVKAILSVSDDVVSLIIRDKQEYDNMSNTLFYRNVARDGIELYSK